jgi:predicted dehydrogenase
MVAYNMRFHPVTKRVKEILKKNTLGKVYSARFFVGQYLPDWRPDIDYRKSYSSKKELGGGVVLDLSHEIDLARFFFGNVESNFHGISQKVSNLEINTEDLAEVHYISESNTLVSIHMDYLVQGYSRHFEIIGEKASVFGDFYNNTVMVVGKNNTIIEKVSYENFSRNSMYVELMESYIRSYGKNRKSPIDIYDGLEILKIALMIKNSSI